IVLGEDLARAGVQDVIGPLMRFREFRGTMFIIVVRGKVQDAFEANQPRLEALVSRWVHNYMHHYDEVSYFLPCNIHEFYTRLKTSSGAPLAVGYGFNVDPGAGKRTANVPDKKVKAYLPGELPKIGGNPVAFAGTAVFKADKLVGFLDTTETRALSILLNKFPKGFFTVEDPLAPKHSVTGAIRNGRKPKIDIDISGEAPVINVDVLLEGEITGIPSGINYETEEYLTLLEAQVSQTIQAHIVNMLQRTQEWGTDVADFGYYIRPKFMTMKEMSNYQWNAKFPYAKINVAVKTELRRTGLMRKTQQIRKETKM
ncbi:MAG: Ger(x)C family spore germination protein, partial [Negativicutes bacterium]|nr:Ger(x)C family spore germination protein [Negativicutes bacterium]